MNLKKNRSVSRYRVIPRLVKSGVLEQVSIIPCGAGQQFDDETDYIVRFIPMEYYEDTYIEKEIEFDAVTVRPKNGVITVAYTFYGEQEWTLSVTTVGGEKSGAAPKKFQIYALFEDLYEKNPYRGDFHAHSTGSDGGEDPVVVAANYRKEGFDILSLTDHSNWRSSEEMLRAYADVPLGIRLFYGEEVHLRGVIHIVNFGSRYSVTELYNSDPEKYHAEIKETVKTLDTPKYVNALEYAYRKWIVEQIRKAGGMAIVPHPYWIHRPEIYNMNSKMLEYVFETGVYDAFELTGGQKVHENNVQNAFYQEMRAKGVDIPIVGSSDSHGTDPASFFNMSKTVLFAKDTEYESVCAAIRDHYSVAVEEVYGEEYRVYGSYRMVKYARFLLDHYFPGHDELCVEEGILMREYALGDPNAANALRTLHGRVEKYMRETLRAQ